MDNNKNFYKKDQKLYNIKNNLNFLLWINSLIMNGYNFSVGLDDIQSLLDKLVIFYELKYPNEMNWKEINVTNEDINHFVSYLNMSEKSIIKAYYKTISVKVIDDSVLNTLFIQDMNNYFDLDLHTIKYDNLMNQDYSKKLSLRKNK